MTKTALRDKGGAEFDFKKTSNTVPLDNPALSQRCMVQMEAQPGGHTVSWKAALGSLLSKRYLKWSPRGMCPELVLSDISISHLDDGRESTLMKFADSSQPGWMASGMWDGIRIQNDLDAVEQGCGEAEREGRREREGHGKSSIFKKEKENELIQNRD